MRFEDDGQSERSAEYEHTAIFNCNFLSLIEPCITHFHNNLLGRVIGALFLVAFSVAHEV